jgi:hypothetical protein
MTSPYSALPRNSFWKTGVSEQHPLDVQGLYAKKFAIGADDRIATAGSCFAQHIGRHLKARNCTVLDVEPAPSGLTQEQAQQFGYGIYSARYAISTRRANWCSLHARRSGSSFRKTRSGRKPDAVTTR